MDKITREPDGDWITCICGNSPDMDGFYTCLADGTMTTPDAAGEWDGKLLACASCGRIVDQDSLDVVGQRDPEGIGEEMERAERQADVR